MSDKNADTKKVERVADAAAQMDEGDTLIWGRLGRSGRTLHPIYQRYSPAVREEFKERGVSIKFLPQKGKYFNPIELLFNDLKSHYIRPNFPKTRNCCRSRRCKRSFENTWMRRRRVRYLALQTARMQLQIKSCNFVLCTRRRKLCVSIARRTRNT